MLSLQRFLRKENPWQEDDLRTAFHKAGWSTEQIEELASQSGVLRRLRERMFMEPLDLLVDDVFTPKVCKRYGSSRVYFSILSGLKNDNVVNLRSLVQMSEGEILRTPNMGRKGLEVIKGVLSQYGLHLGMDLS